MTGDSVTKWLGGSLVVAVVLAAPAIGSATEPAEDTAQAPANAPFDFVHEIVPLLEKRCGECHIGEASQGGFSMNTRDAVLAGGDSGIPGFVSADATASELIRRIRSSDPDERMPADGEPLPDDEAALLVRWIDAGAPWEPGFAFDSNLWEPPLALRTVVLPEAVDGRNHPIDRLVDAYLARSGTQQPEACDDRTFIRRVSLDLTGLLPSPDEVEAYVADTNPAKRSALVDRLLGDAFEDRLRYAEHWLTFFNDLLRNDYTGTGFITGGRKQITSWLHRGLVDNKPYDQLVRELISPTDESRGFIDGIVWRGTVNSSQTVPIQFAQNVGQSFLGINLKCASCHDSFVDRWTLQQTYDFAAILSPEPLELHRCDKATGTMATAGWMFDELGQVDPASPPEERLAQLAALITSRDNGWLSRSLANRLWARLMGRGIVHPVDALRTKPWDEDLLEFLAADLVDHDWDLKHLLRRICTSEAYAAATPSSSTQPSSGEGYAGPLPRRMTAEQFFDALWQLTGTAPEKPDAEVVREVTTDEQSASDAEAAVAADPPMVRASLVKSTALMAALGRPNRDQVILSRPTELTTLEAIQLANEQTLAEELVSGGERILARTGPEPDLLATEIFMAALSRLPNAGERAACHEILGVEPTGQTVADCLWAVMMLPEFQLIR
jgi:hypothetical protein